MTKLFYIDRRHPQRKKIRDQLVSSFHIRRDKSVESVDLHSFLKLWNISFAIRGLGILDSMRRLRIVYAVFRSILPSEKMSRDVDLAFFLPYCRVSSISTELLWAQAIKIFLACLSRRQESFSLGVNKKIQRIKVLQFAFQVSND